MYVPEVSKPAKNTKKDSGKRSSDEPNMMDQIKDDLARMKDELVKRNRDHDDALYNLTFGNFSSDTRKKLDSLFNNKTEGNTENNNGGSE